MCPAFKEERRKMKRAGPVVMVFAVLALTSAFALSADAAPMRAAASAAAAAEVKVPRLTNKRLDIAKDILRDKGLRARVRGGGIFGIVVESNWTVCSTRPGAGKSVNRGSKVTLYVDRYC
jgi:beta-lactam-binding protein with PASTA domain